MRIYRALAVPQIPIPLHSNRQAVIDDGVSKCLTPNKRSNIVRVAIVNVGGATGFSARFLDAEDTRRKGSTVSVGEVSKRFRAGETV